MNWVKLISPYKESIPSSTFCLSSPEISIYERDVERVLFSNAFKRLQNKTQVVPLSDNDYIHNRYTHSLEVAAVGFDIGKRVGIKVWDKLDSKEKSDIQNFFKSKEKVPEDEVTRLKFAYALANIVKAGCLIHDIGNPPFGHQGEAAITEVLEKYKTKNNNFKALAEKLSDIVKIEGNAQSFRLIQLNPNIDLTAAGIVASFKYLRPSKESGTIYKKFGYYESESKEFEKLITATTGKLTCSAKKNSYARHPLTYLVEASDDIAYTLFDFEDFVRAGFIGLQKLEELFNKISGVSSRGSESTEEIGAKLSRLRTIAINSLRTHVVNMFMENYDQILTGDYTEVNGLLSSKGFIKGLLHITRNNDISEAICEIGGLSEKYGYNNKKVLKHGLAGYNVMKYLTEAFLDAYYDSELTHSKMLRGMFPGTFISDDPLIDEYGYIRKIIDELTGMTDRYALQIYQTLNGVNLQHFEI